jgi:hypothetical protein
MRVSMLTVTLVLVMCKAMSLVLSVVGDGVVVKNAMRAMGIIPWLPPASSTLHHATADLKKHLRRPRQAA